MALSQAADGGIAGHDADAVTAVRNQGGAGAEARGRGRGFTAGVPTAYHDDVETFGSGHLQSLAFFGGRSEEHPSELQSLMRISYAVFCLTKKNHQANAAIRQTVLAPLKTPATTTHLI